MPVFFVISRAWAWLNAVRATVFLGSGLSDHSGLLPLASPACWTPRRWFTQRTTCAPATATVSAGTVAVLYAACHLRLLPITAVSYAFFLQRYLATGFLIVASWCLFRSPAVKNLRFSLIRTGERCCADAHTVSHAVHRLTVLTVAMPVVSHRRLVCGGSFAANAPVACTGWAHARTRWWRIALLDVAQRTMVCNVTLA